MLYLDARQDDGVRSEADPLRRSGDQINRRPRLARVLVDYERQCATGRGDRDRAGRSSGRHRRLEKRGINCGGGCEFSVEEDLGGVGKALDQDLHFGAHGTGPGKVSHERWQARVEAVSIFRYSGIFKLGWR